MMKPLKPLDHRDSSHLTVLRMTSALEHVILSPSASLGMNSAKDPYDEPIGKTIPELIRIL
jgi:hypothetical protein